ncbi:MAG: hypothetical protein WDN00_18890 [Limisphaerales bacterium]
MAPATAFFLDRAPDFLALFNGGRQPFARLDHFFFRHMRRGREQFLRIFHEMFAFGIGSGSV